jgi:hypothetical protein
MSKKQIIQVIQKNWVVFAGIGALVIIVALITSALSLKPGQELLPAYALAELWISALAFLIIWITLIVTIFQFRKSMAKPRIKVAFNKKGGQQATLIYEGGKRINALPTPLCLINEGNAISRYFQIDFIIPENIGKQSKYAPITRDDGNYVISYINDGNFTLFVNKPRPDPNINFAIAIDFDKCIKLNIPSFTVKYKVYGDWAETQEEKLKVICKKEGE